MAITNSLVVLFSILGAGAFVFLCYAASYLYFRRDAHELKDLTLATALAKSLGVEASVAEAVREKYEKVKLPKSPL